MRTTIISTTTRVLPGNSPGKHQLVLLILLFLCLVGYSPSGFGQNQAGSAPTYSIRGVITDATSEIPSVFLLSAACTVIVNTAQAALNS